MKKTIQECFPVLFYEFLFSQDEIILLCEEIEDKKDEIKKGYSDKGYSDDEFELGKEEYWTDYKNPIKLLEYEKLIQKIPPQFTSEKLNCEHKVYWTAIYGERGYHSIHNHIDSLHDIPHCNMSSCLHLSDIGGTEFFNPRSSSDEIHRSLFIDSVVGRMVMWPAHILHRAVLHGKKDAERIIVSSNWLMYYSQSI